MGWKEQHNNTRWKGGVEGSEQYFIISSKVKENNHSHFYLVKTAPIRKSTNAGILNLSFLNLFWEPMILLN